jgi:hypothetical protein
MAPPANASFATAVTIGVFPFIFTQSDINDAGTNFTVYYRFIAPAGSKTIGAWGFSGNIGAGYRPRIRPYDGPAGAPVQVLGIDGQNIPVVFPVVAGNEYFLEFLKNVNTAGPEHIDINVQVGPTESVITGDIAVNDDGPGFPAIIQSPSVNFHTRRYFNDVAASDEGNILYPSKEILIVDSTSINPYHLYDYNFNLLNSYASIGDGSGTPRLSADHGANKWYVGDSGTGGGTKARFATITNQVMSAPVSLSANSGMTCLAGNNDNTILYWSGLNTSENTPVRRWDIVGGVALTDLAAALVNYANEDIIVLADDTILISYFKSTVARDLFVRRYNAAGTILNTYSFGGTASSLSPKIARALDNPNSFWVWTQDITGGARISTFRNIKVSDGTTLATVTHGMYSVGIYSGNETATPSARFGNSDSCSFWIMEAGTDFSGIYVMVPNKTNDTLYTGDSTTLDVKIPNPLAQLYLQSDGG